MSAGTDAPAGAPPEVTPRGTRPELIVPTGSDALVDATLSCVAQWYAGRRNLFHEVPLRKPQNQFLLLGELKKKPLLLPQLAQITSQLTQLKKTEEFRVRALQGWMMKD